MNQFSTIDAAYAPQPTETSPSSDASTTTIVLVVLAVVILGPIVKFVGTFGLLFAFHFLRAL